jgi:HAD superfamily hydrolase (TIGR01549 family)
MKRVLKHHAEFPKTAYPETAEVLKTLKDNGYFVGVVTATNRISLDYDIESMKLTGLFDYTQTEEDTDYHKPNPKVFDPAIEWLKTHDVQLNEVLYLGDGLHDMKAALGAGFQFIGTARGFVSVKQFNEQGTQAINHIGELIQES